MKLTTISLLLAAFAIAGYDLAASPTTEASAKSDAKTTDSKSADSKAVDSNKGKKQSAEHKAAKKKTSKKAAEAAKTPANLTEVDMGGLEESLKDSKVVVVNALESGDMIKGSIRITANADDKVITDTLKDKDAKIVTYCGGGKCPAGSTLAYRLIELGYTNVYHYGGGLMEWKANDKPLEEVEVAK